MLSGCARAPAQAYRLALLDLDGVLYRGSEPIPHAPASVGAATRAGMAVRCVTNNAARSPAQVAELLAGMGVPVGPEAVVTSAQAAARLLRSRLPAGAAVLVVGTQALAEQVAGVGLRPVATADEPVDAVVQGYDPRTDWARLAEAAVAVRAGALWVATNTDSTLPSARGPLPGNGALVAAVAHATGAVPLVAGKPEPPLLQVALADAGVPAAQALFVGDRLDTDVAGARRVGVASLLVLTGVTDRAALLAAPAGARPDLVSPDLRGLLEPHPRVEVDGEGARCGTATARLDGGALVLVGPDLPALRAACALAWSRADAGRPLAG